MPGRHSTLSTSPVGDPSADASRPLIVDLDGTLLRTDLLHETASAFISRRPWQLFRLVGWLRHGKSKLKHELATRHALEPVTLPYDSVLSFVRVERARGRRVLLVTASPESQARAIADHLELFDDVIASTVSVNLRGERKREILLDRFGEGGFDYVGNHDDDRLVWASAADAYVVSSNRRLVRQVTNVRRVFAPRAVTRTSAVVRAMRPYQWVKNSLIFLPLLAGQLLTDRDAVSWRRWSLS